jgi:hypothetical protein
MSNVDAVNVPSGAGYAFDQGLTYLSPDALLAYCRAQLGGLDAEIKTQMDAQKVQLHQREAVEAVHTTLESFGSNGPHGPEQMQPCVDAFDKAIDSLRKENPADPVAAQLEGQRNLMIAAYGYKPTRQTETIPLIPGQQPRTVYTPAQLTNPPANDQWKGTTDAVFNLAGDIKSNAEIQMLQLQDLVSQRQQAVQLASGMMSKEDQTLESQAKAIGQ